MKKQKTYRKPPRQKAEAAYRKPIAPPAAAPKQTEEGHTPCPLYRKCGGCQLQNMSYPRQLRWK